MSDGNNESDKENVTPYRCKEPLLSSYLEDKDVSCVSEISCYTPASSVAGNLNSTTSALNQILERVNVNNTAYSDQLDKSEVSFDISNEDKKENEESPGKLTHSEFKEPTSIEQTPGHRRNPFDMSTMDHFPEMSPNVFSKEGEESVEFKWSIDHISEMNPTEISGDQPSYILEAQKREYNDETHQKTVTSFFKSCVIAPSPCVRRATPQSRANLSFGEDKESQTNISLPLDFDLESLLGDKFVSEKSERPPPPPMSDSSFRRMLFDTEHPTEREEEVRELSEPDYIEDQCQRSPIIKEDDISPLSNSNPSFEICNDDNSLLQHLSPIGPKPMSVFQTPARVTRGGFMSTPGPSYLGSTPGYLGNTPGYLGNTPGYPTTTPGRRGPSIMMSTPAPPHTRGEGMEARTPAATATKRRLTPEKVSLFKNPQFASTFSPIHLSNIKRHPKCPKRIRTGSPRKPGTSSPRRLAEVMESADILSPASSLPSPVSTIDSPAGSLTSPDGLTQKQVPMESSRIESGGDISSEGEKEKTKLLQLGIQPLDISEIKVQDNSKKLRTNNYLDISEQEPRVKASDTYSPPSTTTSTTSASPPRACCDPESNTCCDPEHHAACYHGNSTCNCATKDEQVRSKDSGFGTSSAMTTSTLPPSSETTLPPLSEKSELLLDSRPGKRKKHECSPQNLDFEESDFHPPPVKRVVIAATNTGAASVRRKHRSLE